jgi:hypothetical protein
VKPISLTLVRRHVLLLPALALVASTARAQGIPPEPAATVSVSGTVPSAEPAMPTAPAASFFPEAPPEAPPPLPQKKGLVLETRLGGLAFLGKFGEVAPPAPWMTAQLGYEFFRWLMVYGYGEVGFTGTSNEQGESSAIYFPIYGFGGGVRYSVHVTERVAMFVQANGGAMAAIVPRDALTFLGFHGAESLGFALGARLGVEWHQIDHHMALGLGVGIRDAFNFKIQSGESDTPLMLDASAAVRYTF